MDAPVVLIAGALTGIGRATVEGITKSAALEGAAAGVRVNAIAPGPIKTGILDRFTGSAERKAAFAAGAPLKRLGSADEVAQAVGTTCEN